MNVIKFDNLELNKMFNIKIIFIKNYIKSNLIPFTM